jgi:hypothetical protein
LLIDVVGYSKLLVNEQIESVSELNRIVRCTEYFRTAEKNGKLIRVPTGDGMALLFFRSPEEPARCAMEISEALKTHPNIQVRMGVQLDWWPNEFSNDDRRFLTCGTHGSLFEPDIGKCAGGPCAGGSLFPLRVQIASGRIVVTAGSDPPGAQKF